MKTNLQKVLSISGEPGLFNYLSQGKAGIIAEQIGTGKRKAFGLNSKVTSLSDISIYANDDEVKLQEVLAAIRDRQEGKAALSHKSSEKEIVAFFETVLPGYDRDRFYPSHMKKVLQWYNILAEQQMLDFETAEDKEEQEENKEDNK